MTPSRPSLSIELPMAGFQFPARSDGELPRTPEPSGIEEDVVAQPPPPPKQMLKIRKRRTTQLSYDTDVNTDGAIPTIEMSEPALNSTSPMYKPSTTDGFLAPYPTDKRFVTPPPPASSLSNEIGALQSPVHEWKLINDSRDILRYEREGSLWSESEESSPGCGSDSSGLLSLPTDCLGSPDNLSDDPFQDDDLPGIDKPFYSPREEDPPRAKRTRSSRNEFTPEMDQHLENIYVRYLNDPTVTPFKTLRGCPPPLGVASRVAAEAKKTWPFVRQSMARSVDTAFDDGKRPDSAVPDPMDTQIGRTSTRRQPSWPQSGGLVRDRLRQIIRKKPQIHDVYMRLGRSRSSSPFFSAPGRFSGSGSSFDSSSNTAFASRDLALSLVTSTAPSMQPDGPLAQLAQEAPTPKVEIGKTVRPRSQRNSHPANWFGRINRSQARQSSISIQSLFDKDDDLPSQEPSNSSSSGTAAAATTMLASPFDETPAHRDRLLHSMSTTKSLGRKEFDRQISKLPSLDPPIQFFGPTTLPRKRRFKSDEEKPRLEDVFGPQTTLRNRGYSVAVAPPPRLGSPFQ